MSGKNPFLGLGFGNPFITFIRELGNSIASALILNLDAGNRESFSPNVFPRGKDIYGWYVDTNGDADGWQVLLSRDTITSPVGNTPLKMEITGNDPYLESYIGSEWNLANTASGDTWTISVYAKASQSTTGELYLFGADLNSQYVEAPYGTVNITTSWTRVSFTTTFANANTKFLQMRLDGTQSGGSGITIWWDGLQIERGSTVTEFTEEYTVDSNTLDERILDLSSSDRNFTLSGYSVGDKFLEFAGTQYGERTSDSISLNSGATIEVYINMSTVSYSESESAIFNHSNFSYFNLIHKRTSNKFRLEYKSVSSNSRQIFSSLSASADTWFHIVAVVDNTSGGKIYINGALDSSNSDAGNLPSTLNSNAYIGYNTTQAYPQHKYALIREYNRSLTEAEVQQRYTDVQQRYNF